MNKIAKFYDNERGQPWTIRIIDKGDKYGLDDCLTHENEEPTVEFYDADNEHTIDKPSGIMLGQFVSRYYISTIADGGRGGLDLMGYEPKWKMNALVMDSVRSYLMAFAAANEWTWEEDGPFSTNFYKEGVLV
jgi:hypothetical protein|tara:strand:- start:745 stop:1143 length:399 start_codon:yes stop_codon:yes gene_type:complete